MTTQQDASIGLKKETTYKTLVTVDTFYEFTDEDFSWNPTFTQGSGQRYGRRMDAADRRVLTKEDAGGSFTVEGITKGLGKLFEAALGTATSTLAGTLAYQQLFTPTDTDYLPSYTIQKGVPLLGGGAVQAQTFGGCVCSGFELSAKNGDIPTIKFNFMGATVDTATGYATPSYASGTRLLSFTGGSITIGGSVTVPTTTALASGGTSVANIREMDFSYDNNLDSEGFYLGGAGKRGRKNALGKRSGTGQLTAEYTDNVLRDAYLAQTDLALVLTFADTTAIEGSTYPTLQITIPNIRLEGELPKSANGEVVTLQSGFTVLDNRTAAHPLYVAIVTAETAI